MKRTLLITFFILPILVAHAQQPPPKNPKDPDSNVIINMPVGAGPQTSPDTNKIYTSVEIEPTPKGGAPAFYKYLAQNLHYPEEAKKKNIQGKVFLTFIVEIDGSITNVKVLRGVSPDIDAEAVRVIGNSPKWNPGTQGGMAVRVMYNVPLSFSLQNK